jgi:hypothetical protein
MAKKRKMKRIHLIYHLLVFDDETGNLIGNLVDITDEGIRLMCRQAIEPGVRLRFRMVLPAHLDEGSREIRFDAQCVWCKDNIYSDFFGAGFHIEKLSDEQLSVLRALIQTFGYVQ